MDEIKPIAGFFSFDTERIAKAIATLLQDNFTLQSLNLYGIPFRDGEFSIFSEALSNNTSLLEIDPGSGFGWKSFIALEKVLKKIRL